MEYRKTLYIAKNELDRIKTLMTREPKNEAECLGEDDTIRYTAQFPDDFEVDVKCCGVQYREGETNLPWAEAVLFHFGCEVCHTEPAEGDDGGIRGDWELETATDKYIVTVKEKS